MHEENEQADACHRNYQYSANLRSLFSDPATRLVVLSILRDIHRMKILAKRDIQRRQHNGGYGHVERWVVVENVHTKGRVWLNGPGCWAQVVCPGAMALARLESDGDLEAKEE